MYFLVDLYFDDHSHFFGPVNTEKVKYKKYIFLDRTWSIMYKFTYL
jgi:hypothetical protein